MKTDVIIISNDGTGMEEALAQAEKAAQYKGLLPKDALQLRLLTEEMLGMMRSITGERTGRFWIEDQDHVFEIHLQVETMMDFSKQEKLLDVSTSGRNEAARGIMGRIRAFFDPMDWAGTPIPLSPDNANPMVAWSMNSYRQIVTEKLAQDLAGAVDEWDELERSVVSKLADDVKVSIQGRNVEMIILKRVDC